MLKLLTFLCLTVGLYAESEYDIILLASENHELVDSDTDGFSGLNEAGYAWAVEGNTSVIYHEYDGLKRVPFNSDKGEKLTIIDINNQGMAVGSITIPASNWWESSTEKFFTYDTYTNLFRLLDLPIESVWDLHISDSYEITYGGDELHIYNLYDHSIKTIAANYHQANARGQMIGGDFGNSWFYDAGTSHLLGSLDKFNRWNVVPEVLSQNGVVAGFGLNSHNERKGFIWDINGLKEFSLPAEDPSFRAINDNGQILGTFELRKNRHFVDHAFVFSLELGFVDLGTLPKDRISSAYAINNRGQVVGTSENRDSGRAFIWEINNGMRDLNHLITENEGWKDLSSATAINDSGYILGKGYYYGVEKHFLLIPK